MTEQLKSDNSSTPQQTESDVLVLIKKMHQQLAFLEKKIDILISQSQERPFREKKFSKPSRPFGRPYSSDSYQGKRNQGEGFRERSFHSGHPFKKRQEDKNQGFGVPKRNYNDDRESSSSQEGHFKKKFGGKKRGFDPRKKSSFLRRKDQ